MRCQQGNDNTFIHCIGEQPLDGEVFRPTDVNSIQKPDLMVVVAPNGFTKDSDGVATKSALNFISASKPVSISLS